MKRSRYADTEHWNMELIQAANADAGLYWFEPDTLRFFRSRVGYQVYQGPGGIYFVSSEKGPSEIRAFTVRKFNPEDASIDTSGPFNELTRSVAHRRARDMARHGVAA